MIGLAGSETDVTRGGRRKSREEPERRCIATGESGGASGLVRFVLSPEGRAVPDLAGKLPGRGAWLTPRRDLVERAVKKRLFSRAFRQPVEVDTDLADLLERLLVQRLVDTISLARRAGAAVTGAEKVRARITSGEAGVLIQASDAAEDGREKLSRLADATGNGRISRIGVLTSTELGLAFGRDFAIHAALDAGGFAERACAEAARLDGLRSGNIPGGQTDPDATGSAGQDRRAMDDHNGTGPIRGPKDTGR